MSERDETSERVEKADKSFLLGSRNLVTPGKVMTLRKLAESYALH